VSTLSEFTASPGLWVVVGVGSAVMFAGTLLAVPRLVARMPADYFVGPAPPTRVEPKRPLLSFVLRLIRNAVGIVLALAGVAMLVLPGQGILTLLIGVALVDFPGKRALEKRLVAQKHVRKSLQWLRKRAEREPLRFDTQ